MKTKITKRKNGSRRVQFTSDEKTKTEQHHKSEVNINNILERYRRTGTAPMAAGRPMYGDFTNALDFQETKDRIIAANRQFMELPSDIRDMFDNDPGQLLDFVADADNKAEAIEMGLIPKDEPEPKKPENAAPAASEPPETADEPPANEPEVA